MIDLPETPAPNGATAALIDFGSFLTPPLGGPVQRIDRLGTRLKLTVSLPPLRSAKEGRIWVSRLIRGKLEGARMPWPLLDFDPGAPGNVLVNGASQAGSSLIVDGATANYVFREGQFFSIETNGVHHIHKVAEETLANSSGQATLPITPMIRVSPANNDVCHFGKPMIEGFIQGSELAWEMALGGFLGLSFEIHEAE
jgi:hypothetical protein